MTDRQIDRYAIMKSMCTPGYHHNGFVAIHALGHIIYYAGPYLGEIASVKQVGT